MIFFSVIIPTYNRAHLITETIESVLAQTYPHFEVIIVDDGSTDSTKNVIWNRYGQEGRIKYFYKQNEERGAARNFGLKQSAGDYAVFFDSDDWMMPDYLTTLKKIIDKNPGIHMLATRYNYNNNGKIEIHPDLQNLTEGWHDRSFFLKGNILACNFCIKAKNSFYLPFPEERELVTMEDWLFLLANLQTKKIFISKEVCVSMRQHDERSMMNNQKVIKARKKATEWIIQNINLSTSEKKQLKAWSYYFCGVHQYLDHKRRAAIKEILSAIKITGINKKFLLLILKSMIGRKIIARLK